MQRSLSVLIALLLLFLTVGCNLNPETDFKKGLEAYEEKDYKTAEKWYRFAAEQGSVDTMDALALMYANGEGVPRNYQTKPLALRKVFF